ncbi:hypothetical protein POX_h09725 [Penicillium oxalicum]|uniref:hypothetical protein n=1 Tax=Penicillium oxalicum TaxID=69781 RepID=UPI0020B85804|nr:hypothetical protein POX_h09725 [Penicillium oxalicum]KAI2785960.1 hypothetical protein POX_h09725 [Penicillium oxalicum]
MQADESQEPPPPLSTRFLHENVWLGILARTSPGVRVAVFETQICGVLLSTLRQCVGQRTRIFGRLPLDNLIVGKRITNNERRSLWTYSVVEEDPIFTLAVPVIISPRRNRMNVMQSHRDLCLCHRKMLFGTGRMRTWDGIGTDH